MILKRGCFAIREKRFARMNKAALFDWKFVVLAAGKNFLGLLSRA